MESKNLNYARVIKSVNPSYDASRIIQLVNDYTHYPITNDELSEILKLDTLDQDCFSVLVDEVGYA